MLRSLGRRVLRRLDMLARGTSRPDAGVPVPTPWPPAQRSILDAVKSMADRHDPFSTVIDIGASNGMWSGYLLPLFPDLEYLLIEAQPVHEEALRTFCQEHRNAQYVLAAAGEAPGEILFLADRPFGGEASYQPDPDIYRPESTILVPVTTVDQEVQARGLKPPYLIKMDTHGFEIPILNGAKETVRPTQVMVIECYNFPMSAECLLFHEMCAHMLSLGFRCIDLVDPLFRPHDHALFSMDLVFIRADRPEIAYLGYE